MSEAIKELNQESYNLLITKNHDYSNDNLVFTGAKGISARLVDKAQRLFNLSDKEEINHESIQDSILDLINYAHLLNIQRQGLLTQSIKTAFLSGPIDDIGAMEAERWRVTLAQHLGKIGINSFDPARAFNIRNNLSAKAVIEINKRAIEASDIIIANLSGEGRGFGTIREIEYAKSLQKQVIIIGDIVSLAGYDCIVVPTFLALYEFLNIAIPQTQETTKEATEHGKKQTGNGPQKAGTQSGKKESNRSANE